MKNSFECYDLNLLKILEPKIKERTAQMKGIYSQNLIKLVSDMLAIEEAQRPSAAQILNYPAIKPYTNKISLAGGIFPNGAANGTFSNRPGFFKNSSQNPGNKMIGSGSRSLLPVFRNS